MDSLLRRYMAAEEGEKVPVSEKYIVLKMSIGFVKERALVYMTFIES